MADLPLTEVERQLLVDSLTIAVDKSRMVRMLTAAVFTSTQPDSELQKDVLALHAETASLQVYLETVLALSKGAVHAEYASTQAQIAADEPEKVVH